VASLLVAKFSTLTETELTGLDLPELFFPFFMGMEIARGLLLPLMIDNLIKQHLRDLVLYFITTTMREVDSYSCILQLRWPSRSSKVI
jgi:hypothetical protein